MRISSLAYLMIPVLPLVMGAQGDGCAAGSTSPAPDVRGTWNVQCLFAGQMDGTNQALLVGAEVKFTTGFTGDKQ